MAVPPQVPAKLIFYQKNTQIFEIDGLKDQNGNYLDSATVTATLVDQNGNEVAGFVGITMNYVTGSQGIYQGTIDSVFDPATGGGYIVRLDATQGAAVGHWEIRVEVDARRV
jgi:hypothetical protein